MTERTRRPPVIAGNRIKQPGLLVPADWSRFDAVANQQDTYDALVAAHPLVQVQRSILFGLPGDAVYVNNTTGWTVVGAQFKGGPGKGLLSCPAGATRRWRLEIIYQETIGDPSGSNLWLMTGGAPGAGTVRIAVNNVPFTGGPAATYHSLLTTANTAGEPYNGDDATWYAQGPSGGSLSVWQIACVVEDYT